MRKTIEIRWLLLWRRAREGCRRRARTETLRPTRSVTNAASLPRPAVLYYQIINLYPGSAYAVTFELRRRRHTSGMALIERYSISLGDSSKALSSLAEEGDDA